MLLTGVDEAGYGPLLGPLVVAGAAFRVPGGDAVDADASRALRHALRRAVASPGQKARGRLVVGDSKEVYGGTHDPARLELPVLSFLAACSDACAAPSDVDALLRAVRADASVLGDAPWYEACLRDGLADARLPRWADPDAVRAGAAALREAFAASGVSFAGFAAEVLPEARLNSRFAASGNKADVLFATSADVFDRLVVLRAAAGGPVDGPVDGIRAVFDRQGGRRFYLVPLSQRWPQRFAWAIDESPVSSVYRLRWDGVEAEIRFDVKADRDAPHVGLASLLAKYLRELLMDRWNQWFAAVCPGIDGTAGYAQDAQRWLDATRAVRAAAGIADERLVRIR